jgi:TonB family protein
MRSKYRKLLFLIIVVGIFLLPGFSIAQSTEPQSEHSQPMRIKIEDNVQAAAIITKVPPKYPDEAKRKHIEGQIILHAVIAVDGAVKNLTVISGPQELTQTTLEAVKQWRYKQTLINGDPVEVDTTITVDYRLGPNPEVTTTTTEMAPIPPGGMAARPDSTVLRKQEEEAFASVDPATVADIRRLLELSGATKMMSTIFNSFMVPIRAQLLRDLPASEDREKIADTFIKKMEDRASSKELVDLLIPIYAKHFSHEDIKVSLAFFESPSGQRFIQESPSYIQEVQDAASKHWNQIVIPELLVEMVNEFPEIGRGK